MSNGTTWLARISTSFAETRGAWKAVPRPAALYPPPQPLGGIGPIDFPGYDKIPPNGFDQGARDEQNARTAIQSPWVYRNVNAIAQEVSVSTLVMKRLTADGDEDIDQHLLELLWEQPNPYMGRAWLMQFWTWQLLLSGEAYLFLAPKGNDIGEIWPIPSWYVLPVPDEQRFIKHYAFKMPAMEKPIIIDPKYIVYSRLPNPFNIRRGLSPLAALMVDIVGDLAMARWNTAFFGTENATPEGMISVNKDMLDADLARVREEIRNFFGDGKRRVAVARAGDMAWTEFGRSQKDMEFLQGRAFNSKVIDTVFGIPEGYWSKDATRANSEGAKATMIENAVWPKLVLLAEDLNAQVVRQWYGDDLRAEFEDIRPRNRTLELDELKTWMAFLTVDELRKEIDFEPIGDGRGTLLPAEIGKGMTDGRTPEELEQQEQEAVDSMPPAELPEDAPVAAQEAPGGAEPLGADSDGTPTPPDVTEEVKADLRRWETKALKAVKDGKSAAVRFTSEVLPPALVAHVQEALVSAQDVPGVKAVFEDARAAELIDDVWAEALDWAKQVRDA